MSFLKRFANRGDSQSAATSDQSGGGCGKERKASGSGASGSGGRERKSSSDSKFGTGERKKSVFSKINEDWNNFLRDIGSASTMNQHENVM